jgi:hypothetical protein
VFAVIRHVIPIRKAANLLAVPSATQQSGEDAIPDCKKPNVTQQSNIEVVGERILLQRLELLRCIFLVPKARKLHSRFIDVLTRDD